MSVHSGNIPILSTDLRGRWNASNSRNGSAANDLTPNGNDGTLNGTLLTSGCWVLDGVNDTVSFPHSSVYSFDRLDSFTLKALFKTAGGGFQVIASKNTGAGNLEGWGMQLDSGKFEFDFIGDISPTNRIRKQTTATFNDGNWHLGHIVYTGTGTAAGASLYVDGTLETSVNVIHDNLTLSTVNTNSLYFGQLAGFGLFFGGELNFFDAKGGTMTAAEVKAEYIAMKQGLHTLC